MEEIDILEALGLLQSHWERHRCVLLLQMLLFSPQREAALFAASDLAGRIGESVNSPVAISPVLSSPVLCHN